MPYDNDSPRISPAAVAIVFIALIIGALWWMNKYGAGGPSQADTTPIASPERQIIRSPPITSQQLKQNALNRGVQTGQLPVLTPEQARAGRR